MGTAKQTDSCARITHIGVHFWLLFMWRSLLALFGQQVVPILLTAVLNFAEKRCSFSAPWFALALAICSNQRKNTSPFLLLDLYSHLPFVPIKWKTVPLSCSLFCGRSRHSFQSKHCLSSDDGTKLSLSPKSSALLQKAWVSLLSNAHGPNIEMLWLLQCQNRALRCDESWHNEKLLSRIKKIKLEEISVGPQPKRGEDARWIRRKACTSEGAREREGLWGSSNQSNHLQAPGGAWLARW